MSYQLTKHAVIPPVSQSITSQKKKKLRKVRQIANLFCTKVIAKTLASAAVPRANSSNLPSRYTRSADVYSNQPKPGGALAAGSNSSGGGNAPFFVRCLLIRFLQGPQRFYWA